MSAKDFLPKITPAPQLPAPRKAINLMPGYLQTSALSRFFGITVDQLMQPAQQENVSGFIGDKGGLYYKPASDFYLTSDQATRNNYQLEPTVVSVDNNNNTNYVQFYQDIIDSLKFDSALTNNHSRLFSEEYYSWCPPINPDMFVNFTNYYWVQIGPKANVITDPTNAVTDIIGQVTYTTPSNLVLQSGMKVQFTNDANFEYNNVSYIVEGVGSSIRLIDDSLFDNTNLYDIPAYDTTPYDSFAATTTPNYWTITRGSQDGNPWSRTNRWFHKDVIGALNVNDTTFTQATRPIIEFLSDLELRNFARYARHDVKLWSTSDQILDIIGQTSYTIDGATLEDGQNILITGDNDPTHNNRIYTVYGLNTYGRIGLAVVSDGLSPAGDPVTGEGTYIKAGLTNGGKYVYFNGTTWIEGQQKLIPNQEPIFNLYDLNGVRLDDVVEYPGSNFTGSKIFSYTGTPGAANDPVLGIPLSFTTFGEIGFTNYITYQRFYYTSNLVSTEIDGYYFYRQYKTPADQSLDVFRNDWHRSKTQSQQRVKDEYIIKQDLTNLNLVEYPRNFALSIAPDVNDPNLPVNRLVYLNGQLLDEGVDYSITGNDLELSLTLDLSDNDVLEAETWAKVIPELLADGFFEIPDNLNGNPDNAQITQRSFNEIAPQLVSIIQNQSGLSGIANGNNNFRNTLRDLSQGNLLLNHTASMLRVGLFTGNTNAKLTNAIRYNNLEYTAFINKFLIKIQLFINQGYTSSTPTSVWISDALTQINLGKTPSFPFAYSAMTAGNNYIPSSPAALGVTPVYLPTIYMDDTKVTPKLVIQGHDGSIYNTYGDYRDQVILDFETSIYNAIDPAYRLADSSQPFALVSEIPGYFRTTDYDRNEWNQISKPGFERWAVRNKLDYVQNTTYDPINVFTWNYSHALMPDGKFAPGHWRGIYQYFYDTYRPHSHPWEMLGFSQQPTWWITTYGPAPYTDQNVFMWTDIENGYIRSGNRIGTYGYLKRTGLSSLLPVDSLGNLREPAVIGLVVNIPNEVDAQGNWEFGDFGPVEFKWRSSNSYSFDLSEAAFLAKPARFVDIFWEARKLNRLQDQLYDTDFKRRYTSADLTVHNEILDDGTRAIVKGISNWVSDYMTSLNLDLATYFGDIERNLGAKLAYKAGAFIKKDTLRINSESFGLVPTENITTKLYKGSSIAQPTYSAVIIIWDGTSYRVSGYDSIAQKFLTIPGESGGIRTPVTINGVTVERLIQSSDATVEVPYYTSMVSRQAVYDFLIAYQRYLESQGWIFNDYDNTNASIKDFTNAANDFLTWSQVPLLTGDSIILSPASDHLLFTAEHGHIENLGQYVNGVYGILDRTGFGINTNQLTVTRDTGLFEVVLNDSSVQGIYCLRLSLVEYEHIVLLDNKTDFGQLVYDPVLGIRQPRLQLFANRTTFWNGEPLAAGFIVQDGDLTDNFEQSVDNFRRFYDFDLNPATGIQNELAQHSIGFQERDYMANLLLDTTAEFDYYKGFIGSKGTLPSYTNILRNENITKTAGFDVLEEWAFLIGEYGNTERKSSLELQIRPSDFTTNPQLIEFVNTVGNNPTYIDITPSDSRWVLKNKNNATNNQFKYRDFENRYRKDLPNAGYVQVNETTYTVLNTSAITDLFNTVVYDNTSTFKDGDTVWQIILDNGGWTVYRVCKDVQITSIETGANPSDPTVFTTDGVHNLQPNDKILLQVTTATSGELQGVQTVLNTTTNSPTLLTNQFSIDTAIDTGIVYPTEIIGTVANPVFVVSQTIIVNGITATLTGTGLTQAVVDINAALILGGNITTKASATEDNKLKLSDETALALTITSTAGSIAAGLPLTSSQTGQFIYVLKPVRFADATALAAFTPPTGWVTGDKVFVDDNGINLWTVRTYNGVSFDVIRTQQDKIDIDQLYNVYIYDSVSNKDVLEVQLYDPFKGIIFSTADKELKYKLDFDPAKYNNGDATVYQIDPELAWGNEQVGQLWWDLSTTRFLDYEQGTLDYRRKNWGTVAPGVIVNVYEWVKSPVVPSGWDSYVLSQATSGINRPTGTTIYGDDTPYVSITKYDALTNMDTTSYYFWVLNPNTVPAGKQDRNLSALNVAQLIQNRNNQGIVWIAPISTSAFILNNAENFINDKTSVLQVTFYEREDESIIHKQWILEREQDAISVPYIGLWNKMRDSLVGFDDLNLSVPDPTLSSVVKYGNSVRPRQTWFKNRLQARSQFFTKANEILLAKNVVSITGWDSQLYATDPLPNVSQYDYLVATRADRNLLQGSIVVGKKVLVENDELLNGYWSLWQYAGGSSWTLLSQQQYRAIDYWTYVDWYADGYSSATTPKYTWANVSVMNANSGLYTSGDIIKVLDNGTGNFSMYLYTVTNALPSFLQIAEQNGTIKFLDALSNYDVSNTSLDAAISTVTKTFVSALKDNLLGIEETNILFFTMVHYVHFEQTIVSWVFKTSTLYGQGKVLPFRKDYILPANETDNLVDFFNEAKPYHVKLRTLTEQRRTQVDQANVHVTDTRFMDIGIMFDRVTYQTNIPEGANPKDYVGQVLNAADRIQLYYAPTEGMPPKVLQELINRSEYGGTILDGKNFYQFGTILSSGYDNQPYDNTLLGGYDFTDAYTLGSVLNPTVGIGDTLIINGVTTTFTGTSLNQVINDLNNNAGLDAIGIVAGFVNTLVPSPGQYLQIIDKGNIDLSFSGTAQAMLGFPNSVLVNQLTPSDLESFYDVFVNGGDPLGQIPTFNEVPQNDSTINVDGNQFIQPYLDENHPEELSLIRAGDAVIIDVYTYDQPLNNSGYASEGYDNFTTADLLGTTPNPVFNIGDTLVINGFTVTLTGTSLLQAIYNINANIDFIASGISASIVTNIGNNFLQISQSGPNVNMTLSGNVQVTAGLATSLVTTIPPSGSYDLASDYPPPNPANTLGLRIFKNIFGRYEYLRISDAHTTTLTQPLLNSDKVVVVNDSTVLGQPNIPGRVPGVVFINGERITFWDVDTSTPGQHQLLQCMRGTQGTGINLDLDVGVAVRDASPAQIIPGNEWLWYTSVGGLQTETNQQAEFLKASPGNPQ